MQLPSRDQESVDCFLAVGARATRYAETRRTAARPPIPSASSAMVPGSGTITSFTASSMAPKLSPPRFAKTIETVVGASTVNEPPYVANGSPLSTVMVSAKKAPIDTSTTFGFCAPVWVKPESVPESWKRKS